VKTIYNPETGEAVVPGKSKEELMAMMVPIRNKMDEIILEEKAVNGERLTVQGIKRVCDLILEEIGNMPLKIKIGQDYLNPEGISVTGASDQDVPLDDRVEALHFGLMISEEQMVIVSLAGLARLENERKKRGEEEDG